MTAGELAFGGMSFAVGGRQGALLRVFLGGPIGVSGFAVDVGEGGVEAVQVRQLFGGFVVEEEAAAKLAALHTGVGDEGRDVGRRGAGFLELVEGGLGDCLIGHAETVDDARIIGEGVGEFAVLFGGFVEAFRAEEGGGEEAAGFVVGGLLVQRAAQGRDGFGGLIQREAGRAEGDEGGQGSGLRFEDGFQGGDGFALVAGHVEGESEVEQQSGVAGLGFYELLVEGDGFLETAGAHELVGLRQSCGEGVGLGLEDRRG